jgi:hypothetical protein
MGKWEAAMRYWVLAGALALGACAMFQIQDSYGNRYGGWYAHGDTYKVQLDLCERETASPLIPPAGKQPHMLQCMIRLGVPSGNITPAPPSAR